MGCWKGVTGLLFLCAFEGGCSDAEEAPTTTSGAPAIFVSHDHVDLGEVLATEEPISVEFTIENRGTADLVIHQVTLSCGCSTAKPGSNVVAPGDETLLTVLAHPRRAERRSVRIDVVTNDPEHGVVHLAVSWLSHADVSLEPQEIDFGQLRPGESAVHTVTIKKTEDTPAFGVVRTLTSPQESVMAEPTDRPMPDSGGVLQRFDVRVTAGSDGGVMDGRVSFTLVQEESASTGEGDGVKRLAIPLRWEVIPDCSVKPSSVFLGVAAPGAALEFGLEVLHGEGSEAVALTGASLESGREIELLSNEEGPGWLRLRFRALMADHAGASIDTLVLKLRQGNHDLTRSVRLSGVCRDVAASSVEP